ncbi:predicted protein [Enterococcus faecium 1,231,501]|nr:predicted protein [Enterococcus faecium 1,231,501]EEV50405.1 predicted protein [Enterococcus faecium 1,141,733]EEV58898.1 predicted protein [Enterococcus faecium Com12]
MLNIVAEAKNRLTSRLFAVTRKTATRMITLVVFLFSNFSFISNLTYDIVMRSGKIL